MTPFDKALRRQGPAKPAAPEEQADIRLAPGRAEIDLAGLIADIPARTRRTRTEKDSCQTAPCMPGRTLPEQNNTQTGSSERITGQSKLIAA